MSGQLIESCQKTNVLNTSQIPPPEYPEIVLKPVSNCIFLAI